MEVALTHSMAEVNTRSKDFLVSPSMSFSWSQLPSTEEVLAVVLYKLKLEKTTIRAVASSTIDEVLLIWDKARIPTFRKDNAITKLEAIYKEYTLLKKGKSR
jgi:hypothetical protein